MKDIELIHGDCVYELDRLISNGTRVNLTVTSPPYDNLRTYKDTCDWNFDIFKEVANRLYNITKEGGVIIWIVGDSTINGSESGTSFRQALYFKEIGFDIYDTMIWEKPSPQSPTHGRYYDVFEYMFVFSKGKPSTLNLISDRKNKSVGNKSKKETRSCREDRKIKDETRIVPEYSRRFNVWNISRGSNKTSHPAVFPFQLAKDHIDSWSNEGDTVLDPFMGSGTTGLACKDTNRNFIGIEKVKEYFDISKNRIENHHVPLMDFNKIKL